ncbi:MAG TPA: hypothetical protein VD865_00395 [Stenotrophomonas sp.]|nr:hypothetical protein [Stenotrophomonas sp.]
MMLRLLALTVLALSVPAMAAAAEEVPLDLRQPTAKVKAQIDQIYAGLSGGEVYSEITLDQRGQVREALARISTQIDRNGEGSVAPQQEAAMMNDQELVNTILTQAREDSRLICRREKSVGSHRVTTSCMTVAQRRRSQDRSQQDMSTLQRTGHNSL